MQTYASAELKEKKRHKQEWAQFKLAFVFAVMKEEGLNQKAFAELYEKSQMTITNWKQGTYEVPDDFFHYLREKCINKNLLKVLSDFGLEPLPEEKGVN